MREVQEWITSTPITERAGEVAASFEVCIWMITANGRLSEEERELFEDILSQADLPDEEHQRLNEALVDPPSLQDIETRLTHPVLRELALGMCWEFAVARVPLRSDGPFEPRQGSYTPMSLMIPMLSRSSESSSGLSRQYKRGWSRLANASPAPMRPQA